jgi:hypothetical protein
MKKRLLLFLLTLFCNALCAQDLIVTNNNDSINCQILTIDAEMIHFYVMKNNEKVKSSLPWNQVLSSSSGYYSKTEEDYVYQNKNIYQKKNEDYAHFRIAIVVGYSYRFLLSHTFFNEDYYKQLKNGYHYGMELNYYFNESLGIGINWHASHFNSKSAGNYDPEKTRIRQFIPIFSTRTFDKKKQGAFLLNIGVGYISYKDEYRWNYHNDFQTPEGIGILLSAGYDIPISQTMAIYLQSSITSGPLDDINNREG